MWLIDEKHGNTFGSVAKALTPKQMKSALSPLAFKILQELTEPKYPKELAKKLKVHEQKVYYHIRNLEKSKIIEVVKTEGRRGSIAKYYMITDNALALLITPMEKTTKLFSMKTRHKKLLEPFIENGKLNSIIIMGSPDPHGPVKVRARDSLATTNIGLFLGTFLNHIPPASIRLDVDVKEDDLKKNLILIGGPGVNSITQKVNKSLSIKFKRIKHENNFYYAIYSNLTKKSHMSENSGIVVKAQNPFNKSKSILVVAGRRANGTAAALTAIMKYLDIVCDKSPIARVVEGLDVDSDGIIDAVEFLE